uniref:CRAL-TRIO domain-containing protein n=1 Tax=Ciona savignyi TaxID=51511 RepID=H2YVL2_CIOSA
SCCTSTTASGRSFPEVFEKYSNPKALTAVLESGILYVVEGKTSEGEAIVIYRPDKHTAHINIFDVFACGQIAIDQLLESEEVQICGIITIDDFQHFDPDSIKHVTLTEHGKVTKLLQDATPIRRKPVHVLNESGKFDVIYALMKPFMKRKFS